MPSPIITFERVYDFMIDKYMSMNEHKQHEVFLRAEGLIGGQGGGYARGATGTPPGAVAAVG